MSAVLHLHQLGPLPQFMTGAFTAPVKRIRTPPGDAMWLVSDYVLGRRVLSDRRFSRAAAVVPGAPRLNSAAPSPTSIMSLDGTDHARLRRIVAAAFTTGKVAALAPLVQRTAADLLEGMSHCGSTADLVTSFAEPLPVAVLGTLLGVPVEDREIFDSSVEVLFDITASSDLEKSRQRLLLVDYMSTLIDRKRQRNDNDLLTDLIRAHDGDALSKAELVSLGLALLTAGYETTVGQISLAALAILQGGVPREFVKDESRVNELVEELLRANPSTALSFPRVALEDVELGDISIRAGEAVVVSLLHGNRDDRAFAEPEILREDRSAAHLTFGHGIHRCLGAPLARLQVRTALLQLFAFFPALRLAEDEPTARSAVVWKDGLITRGLDSLRVTW
ncbi:cytochrome P450 [Streptomyces sp. BE133]|uniref:cytochrome P450 n=1 Tax=Streptomyces sp. BE133 TaxID=3002523 RepID=UPI002E76103F|nr:cytochrome P450 [Streptomyces sp. BE133]MEE1808106.1 cytochrome P450 [Streptomyces sp. BE133]